MEEKREMMGVRVRETVGDEQDGWEPFGGGLWSLYLSSGSM
jgi:hypothetical protein